jgi:ribosomal protein L11 methyltransferase
VSAPPPSCYRLVIGPVPETSAQTLAQRLSDIAETMAGGGQDLALSVFEAEGGHWTVETISIAPPDLGAIQHVLADLGVIAPGSATLNLSAMAHEDWVQRSYRGLPPVNAGSFVIYGRHDRERVAARRFAIQIEAGQAFGTAHHGTTQGCLLALDLIMRRGGALNVLDVGTGSGVLAIATARAGAKHILASDIDAIAVGVARENARINGVLPHIRIIQADGLRDRRIQGRAPYDLILANLLPRPLKAMARDIADALAPDGVAVLSGLLDNQASALMAHFASMGLCRWRRIDREGWATLMLKRR